MMPVLSCQLAVLQTPARVPLLHQLRRLKPRAQTTKREPFRMTLKRGFRPRKQWKRMVSVREATVARETARSCGRWLVRIMLRSCGA